MSFSLRPFRYTDLAAVIALAQNSFADEFTAQGLTPEGFAVQTRLMTRGWMLPMRLLSALMRLHWEIWVAEADDHLVGCGAFSGKKRMSLHTLMVDPRYRRQGIGQALLVKRLERIKARGYPCAVVTILQTNTASLGNLSKQHFQIVDKYSLYELALPIQRPIVVDTGIQSRPILTTDRLRLVQLEQTSFAPLALKVNDSSVPSYLPSLWMRAMDRLQKTQIWNRAFLLHGQPIGFVSAAITSTQPKGFIARPLIATKDAAYLLAILHEAAAWMTQQGKSAMQIIIPEGQPDLLQVVEDSGWKKLLTWVELARWFQDVPIRTND